MSYVTITDLPELSWETVSDKEYIIVSNGLQSYKMPIKYLVNKDIDINERLEEMENRVFQQSNEPLVGVNSGDVWLNTYTSEVKIYKQTDIGTYSWESLLFKQDDVLDGGEF